MTLVSKYTFTESAIMRWRPPVGREKKGRECRVAAFCPTPISRVRLCTASGWQERTLWQLRDGDRVLGEVELGPDEMADSARLRRAIVSAAPLAIIEANESEHLRAAMQHRRAAAGELPIVERAEFTGWSPDPDATSASFVTRRSTIGAHTIGTNVTDAHVADLVAPEDVRGDDVHDGVLVLLRGHHSLNSASLRTFLALALVSPALIRRVSAGRAPVLALLGPSGVGKSPICGFIARAWSSHPGAVLAFTSTVGSVERALSVAGDQPTVVDDLKLSTSKESDVTRLVQNIADKLHRERLTAEAERGREWPVRATLVIAGEDFVRGEISAVGRLLPVHLARGDVDGKALANDSASLLAVRAALGAYLAWLAPNYGNAIADARAWIPSVGAELQRLAPEATHARMYENGALALSAFVPFLRFASSYASFDLRACLYEMTAHVAAMIDGARGLGDDARIGTLFIRDLVAAWSAGQVRIVGWAAPSVDYPKGKPVIGTCIGDRVYLNPEACESVLRPLWQSGARSRWSLRAVGEALDTEGFLVKREKGQLTVKDPRTRSRAWAISAERFEGGGPEDDGSDPRDV